MVARRLRAYLVEAQPVARQATGPSAGTRYANLFRVGPPLSPIIGRLDRAGFLERDSGPCPAPSVAPRGEMIVGIGTDLLAVPRMARELERDRGGFRSQLFSSTEIADCEARGCPARHYAARFAAKEAVFKALGARGLDIGAYREIEIRQGPAGEPVLRLHRRLRHLARRRGVVRAHVTLSHTGEFASAVVVLESALRPVPAGLGGPDP